MDREDIRDVGLTLMSAAQGARWAREQVEPLEHPELYAALTHVVEAAIEAADALDAYNGACGSQRTARCRTT